MYIESLNTRLAEIYSGTPWVIVADNAVSAVRSVDVLRGWGVEEFLVVSAAEGLGELPDDVEIHLTGSPGGTVMNGIRAFARSLDGAAVRKVITKFDEEGRARVLSPTFGGEAAFGTRKLYGRRRKEWLALEDKTIIDDLFDVVGVERVPSAVVPVAAAGRAAQQLGTELGTVWAADNREGWHGGGEYTRWVPSPRDYPRPSR